MLARVRALRPAVVTFSFLGNAQTTGAPFVDYVLADSVAASPERPPSVSGNFISQSEISTLSE